MRTTLSINHLAYLVESNKIDEVAELSNMKKILVDHYDAIKKIGGFSDTILSGCTACTQKNIRFRKNSMLNIAVILLTQARTAGSNLSKLIEVLSETEGAQITQLDLVMPVVQPRSTGMRNIARGNTVVSRGITAK